jgi:integrase
MKCKYRLFRRSSGIFFVQDNYSGRQESLHTREKQLAMRLVSSMNEAYIQPAINLQIAKAYLAAADPTFNTRTWRDIMREFINIKTGTNRSRYERAVLDKAYDSIRDLKIIETHPEHFLRVLKSGRVSTNNHLRRLHNFAVDMGWLPWPVMPKRQWPPIKYKEKRAVTFEEHQLILSREPNRELRAFLWCCWHLGGAQSDMAHLKGEDIDWSTKVVSFFRCKTGTAQIIHFGDGLAEILRDLPSEGPLFPTLSPMDEKHRAGRFQRSCRRVGVIGISLHSYRYAWAERAKTCGYPERFAQVALGHNSLAVHRAYAKKAKVKLPCLEEYEKNRVSG